MVYIPSNDAERRRMIECAGFESFDDLFAAAVPKDLWRNTKFDLPSPMSESELDSYFKSLTSKNTTTSDLISFLGAGIYNHYIPAAVKALISRSEFYTAYTPYQAEVSQGTLQSIFEYQTMISEIMGLDVSNASLYDGASACAEAALMVVNQTGRDKIVVPGSIHPHYLRVMQTYLSGRPVEIARVGLAGGLFDPDNALRLIDDRTAAVFVQQPNFFGLLEDAGPLIEHARSVGALSVMVVDPVSLGVLKPPGEYGADVAVAEGQPFGIPQALGGPLLGMMVVNKNLIRRLPGRLVARTIDDRGNTGYCLTLQTREQHIRRDKATSNICTNQALCALAATIYLSLLGTDGLRKLGEISAANAHYAFERIIGLDGYKARFNAPFFREFVIESERKPSEIIESSLKKGVLPGVDLSAFDIGMDNCLMMAFTERNPPEQADRLVEVLNTI
jgi:glycine dehydrogenase subunit 1